MKLIILPLLALLSMGQSFAQDSSYFVAAAQDMREGLIEAQRKAYLQQREKERFETAFEGGVKLGFLVRHYGGNESDMSHLILAFKENRLDEITAWLEEHGAKFTRKD